MYAHRLGRFVVVASLVAALASCGGGGGALGSVVNSYSATAAVGDFLKVSVDSSAHTISYQNLTNGQSGTVPYTVAADGSYLINDPQGNLLTAYELPGYALVLEVDHAGPLQNTHCLAFAVNQAPISLSSLSGGQYNFMQFRVNSGGMEIGHAAVSTGQLTTTQYWPYGSTQGSAFSSGSMDMSGWQNDPSGNNAYVMVPDEGGTVDYIFATPSGVLAVDTPNGNIICLQETASKDFPADKAGTYKAIVYGKDNASTGQGNVETGTAEMYKGTMSITATGHLTVTDPEGGVIVDTDLQPVADNPSLVGPGKLSNSCKGLFTFSVNEGGSTRQVFVAFIEGALFVSSFKPLSGYAYSYLYGIGLKL